MWDGKRSLTFGSMGIFGKFLVTQKDNSQDGSTFVVLHFAQILVFLTPMDVGEGENVLANYRNKIFPLIKLIVQKIGKYLYPFPKESYY